MNTKLTIQDHRHYRIKTLVWSEGLTVLNDTTVYIAETPLGLCSIVRTKDGRVWYGGYADGALEAQIPCKTLETAKQLAQREFGRIVSSCLTVD